MDDAEKKAFALIVVGGIVVIAAQYGRITVLKSLVQNMENQTKFWGRLYNRAVNNMTLEQLETEAKAQAIDTEFRELTEKL